ncbi:hypothetical protein [aff. Roholtiella sp. LEGE 12411]|nr:hypothetical protein [aff. Roholtiella sp. LEGE 12411]
MNASNQRQQATLNSAPAIYNRFLLGGCCGAIASHRNFPVMPQQIT